MHALEAKDGQLIEIRSSVQKNICVYKLLTWKPHQVDAFAKGIKVAYILCKGGYSELDRILPTAWAAGQALECINLAH